MNPLVDIVLWTLLSILPATFCTQVSVEAICTPASIEAVSQIQTSAPASIVSTFIVAPAPSARPANTPRTGKRGLAFNQASLTRLFGGLGSEVSWAYNWGQSCPELDRGLEFVPMLWGLAPDLTGTWTESANTAIGTGSRHLLSFNEPDLSAQSNISPSDAAAGYKKYMQQFAGRAGLGAPAVTNGESPMGLAWLSEFLNGCSGCTIDFVPIHWYGPADSLEYFKNYIAQAHSTAGGRPIWITEFAATGSLDQQAAFLKDVMPWLDSLGYVQRYAYFSVDNGLVDGAFKSVLGDTFDTYVKH